MAERIVMPKAGMAMEKGTIISWLKDVGDRVSYGEPLLEIETDKTTMQVESLSEGYLLAKLYEAGAEIPVVTTIGYIGEQGEAPPLEEIAAPTAPAARTADAATMRKSAAESPSVGAAAAAGKIPATPLARKLARERHIDLGTVRGSGQGGKIFSRDLPQSGQEIPSGIAAVSQKAGALVKLNGMRKTIARRMLKSHTEIPPVTLHSEADVTALAKLRGEINSVLEIKITFNDLVVRSCAVALSEFPEINASYTDDGVLYHGDVNIGVAVAVDGGLIVPVIKNADRLTLKALAFRAKELSENARAGRLAPDEYTDGTFTVSNLGMFGVTAFTPIINLPESCILGVCAVKERVVLKADGGVEGRKYMGLSLTFDHRCIDGAGAARFLQRVAALLENPPEMLI